MIIVKMTAYAISIYMHYYPMYLRIEYMGVWQPGLLFVQLLW